MPVNSLFISHGAPDEVLHDSPARRAWQSLAVEVDDRPLVVVSAHNESRGSTIVGSHPSPPTIHDFGRGFDPALFAMEYPATGAPQMATEIVEHIVRSGIRAKADVAAGLDHGVWAPLSQTFPRGNRIIIPVSIDPGASPQQHYCLGLALAEMGRFVVIGSGALTHNLRAVQWRDRNAHPNPHAVSFADWAARQWESEIVADLLDAEAHPEYGWNHPTPEHLMPLFVSLGASRARDRRVFHRGYSFGVLAMDIFVG